MTYKSISVHGAKTKFFKTRSEQKAQVGQEQLEHETKIKENQLAKKQPAASYLPVHILQISFPWP